MQYISEADVRRLLPMATAVDLMQQAFEELGAKTAVNHPRRRLVLPTGSVLHYMVGGSAKYFGAKIYSTNPRHGAHFLVALYRAEDGEPLALLEANHLGQIRTGAASGLATRYMARAESARVGIIGSGFQAETQLAAMLAVRKIESVKVWSRSEQKRTSFASDCTVKFAVPVKAAGSAREVLEDADVVVTATNAKDPVFEAEWIMRGAHINAMGSNQITRRELPGEILARAELIAVDSEEQAAMESGDLALARKEGSWDGGKVVELAEIVAGRVRGRNSERSVTIFKSNGLAIEDVVSAGYIYEQFA